MGKNNKQNQNKKPVENKNVDKLQNNELLRLSTAGSVDDGKSTLIGRLLYDTKSVMKDLSLPQLRLR